MCYYIEGTERPLIAKKDILVSKSTDYGCASENTFESDHRGYIYRKGQINAEVQLKPYGDVVLRCIDEGYHSYRSTIHGEGLFVIPKGSTYYASYKSSKEYVSSQIIYLGKNSLLKRLRYRFSKKQNNA